MSIYIYMYIYTHVYIDTHTHKHTHKGGWSTVEEPKLELLQDAE